LSDTPDNFIQINSNTGFEKEKGFGCNRGPLIIPINLLQKGGREELKSFSGFTVVEGIIEYFRF
jgi:hypothetical protein